MMPTSQSKPEIRVGVLHGGKVHLVELCPDPDGVAPVWMKTTGEVIDATGCTEVGTATKNHGGSCDDTGEFVSRAAVLVQELLSEAPAGTTLMVFARDAWAGTRTFGERVDGTYYHQ